ncbi:pyruvate kinase [Aliiruegeria lutimaris]|uniref:Pyruvate kinase n=1 Tax=Aliiruegeria lutimaris TaxID=571298 RepID=A0A1G8WQ54_9RHOB|nr:pyruvate kinase [Aliiruegeria lutimaris]SDJ80508.1 pyruvate kinase [Aliiruegeria lutimaris]
MNSSPNAPSLSPTESAAELHANLSRLRDTIEHEAGQTLDGWRPAIEREDFLPSAENLARYLAMRKVDLRGIQDGLVELGMSSLGRCESHIRPTLDAASATLASVAGLPAEDYPLASAFFEGPQRVARARDAMFGQGEPGTRIMVTLPTEAAEDENIIRQFVYAGANSVRINCAHDDETAWAAMIRHVRTISREVGRDVRINMDLGGPKVRTDLGDKLKGKRLFSGDRISLVYELPEDRKGLAVTTLNHPELIDKLVIGSRVWLDDGKIGGVVESLDESGAVIEVTSVRPSGVKIKHGKGVNLPGVAVEIPALTEKDLNDLDFVARHADTIGFSFVQTPQDVRDLIAALQGRLGDAPLPAVMLKIETELAVRNLPRLLVQAGGKLPVAVMIARGDLSVELGMDRTSEMQEEILWMCAAAHVPTVWATQVLESLMKEGLASRAEVTDAAMGQRAECVMLNKGPYAPQGIAFLQEVLRRMARHHGKRIAIMGPLNSWREMQQL